MNRTMQISAGITTGIHLSTGKALRAIHIRIRIRIRIRTAR